ncbi:MAG: hypothetical protein GC204_00520 [Chloroflexi bacterium]|nr:hypothetical protein [Chloroflexota bacterium]
MLVRRLIALLFALLVTAVPAFAQQPSDPNVNIVYPLAVYSFSGSVNIVGTANPPGMTVYFLESRPLIDARTPVEASVPWQPVTLPTSTPVINGILGTWDTTLMPDGLYELRLTVFTNSTQVRYARVSPLRVLNNLPPFAITPVSVSLPQPSVIIVTATPTNAQFAQQPVQPPASGSPQVTAAIDANVRVGDSVGYAPVGALLNGQSAPILGVSSTGSGWWLIQLPDGRQGWIAGSTVRLSGDISRVPLVAPPMPTATPTPTATATPVNLPDATIANVRLDVSGTLHTNQAFNFIVTVTNNSPSYLPAVTVACNVTPHNEFFSTTLGGLPPFGQTDVTIPAKLVTGGGETVTANCAVDVNNLVSEANESNNYYSLSFPLGS